LTKFDLCGKIVENRRGPQMSDLLDVINKLKEEKRMQDGIEKGKIEASGDHAAVTYESESRGDCSGVAGLRGVFGYSAVRSTFY